MKHLFRLLLFIPMLSFGQDKTYFDYGFFASPEINQLKAFNPSGNEVSTPQIGISAGLLVEYHINNRISLRSGIAYGLKQYNHSHGGLVFGSDIDPQVGYVGFSTLATKYKYSEIQIPVHFQYHFSNRIFASVGADVNAIFADQTKRTLNSSSGETEELSSSPPSSTIYLAPTLSFGYRVIFKTESMLTIEPTIKPFINGYVPENTRLMNYGIKLIYYPNKLNN